jgi:hypothetical protein
MNSTSARSMQILVAAVTLISVFALACQIPLDPDMWWHLRAGDELLRTGHVLTQDIFSYTRAGAPWVNVFWLSDLVMALVFRGAGFLGLAALLALVVTAGMAVVYRQMDVPPFLRAFLIILAAAAAAPTWTVRPQIVSFLMLAVLDLWLVAYRAGRFRHLWLLPVLFALWVNLHGAVIWGWLLLLAVLAGEALDHWLAQPEAERLPWENWRKLGFWSLLTLPAVLLNPSGLAAWTLPFQQVSVSLQYIHEWFSPDFHIISYHPFLWMLFALLAAVGLSGRLMRAADFLKVAGFAYLAFTSQRNLGPFAVIAAPVLARYMWLAMQAWRLREKPWLAKLDGRLAGSAAARPVNARLAGWLNGMIIILLALAALVRLWSVASNGMVAAFLKNAYPQAAVRWIQSNQPAGNLFNAYNWGGYLTWELRDYPVFIDGRADMYGQEFISQWFMIANAAPGWQDLLDRWDVNLVLIEPWQPVVAQLPQNGWHLLYEDDMAVVYGR